MEWFILIAHGFVLLVAFYGFLFNVQIHANRLTYLLIGLYSFYFVYNNFIIISKTILGN